MKVPDNLIFDYFRLTTDIPEEKYIQYIKTDIRQAHFVYAREIVKVYHGEDAVLPAEKRYISIASGTAPEKINVTVNKFIYIDNKHSMG